MTITIALRSGTLQVQVERADLPLEELCGFASRRSRKRGFVFVSKVLGKHYPVRPARMSAIHTRLAEKLADVRGPVVLVALAETATGLGHGIADAWQRWTGRDDLLFLHTTRYRLDRPLALVFEEPHSHATRHLLYQPVDPANAELFCCARSLILVDDEMSSGRTLVNLATAYRRLNRQLEAVHLTCITDWLGGMRRLALAEQIGVRTHIHSLLEGSYCFVDDPAFDPGPIPQVHTSDTFKDAILKRNWGRLGLRGRLCLNLDAMIDAADLRPGQRVLVLGTGEFAYPPFLLARRLEELGHDVYFQSTTRSPLLVDCDITTVLECVDNYHDFMPNYVYNVDPRRYDRMVLGYETAPLPAAHDLPEMLRAFTTFF